MNELTKYADDVGVAAFEKIPGASSWTVICKQGYHWEANQNPSWGDLTNGTERPTANLSFNPLNDNVISNERNSTVTLNGQNQSGQLGFRAGCWPDA